MKRVRLGIAGVGNMGSDHARRIKGGEIKRAELVAVCDVDKRRLDAFDESVKKFTSSRKMIRSGEIDAILVATPHYQHTTIGIDALEQGLHVLVEKPISVHKADCERLIAAHKKRKQVFAAMFNQRTDPHYVKVKKLIDDGELGKIMRATWIITSWFRPEAYYASGGWRATWAGEGGGVLLNQCPHNLDLMQWICGMPIRVRGFCAFGKRHKIEVEDEVTAYFEYKNGATGLFVTSTGEAPGTNRLEICADMGKVVVEGGKISFTRNTVGATRHSKTTKALFSAPETWEINIPVNGWGGQHKAVTQNFADAILDGVPLIAPAKEGIRSVELANAMLYSSLLGKPIDLPMDAKGYERQLKKLIRNSRFAKKSSKGSVASDMSSSF